ncbi:MAG TPA: penicillin-binding transpeptidase domain-containing protein [Actinocrinis sp.]
MDETAVAPRVGGRTEPPTVRAEDSWRPYGAASSSDSMSAPPPSASPPRRPDRPTLRYTEPAEVPEAWRPDGGSEAAAPPRPGAGLRSDAETDVMPPDAGMAVRGGSDRPPFDEYRTGQDYDRSRSAVEGLSVSERMARFERMSSPAGTAAGGWGSVPGGGEDDFDQYEEPDGPGMARRPPGSGSGTGGSGGAPRSRRRRGLLISGGVAAAIVAVAAVLALTGAVTLPGLAAKPVPTVGFSPNSAAAGSPADQTGNAFLNDWMAGNVKAASNITDNPAAALTALTTYKKDLQLSGLTISPGSAGSAGWLTFGVSAQVGKPASTWTYNSGLAAYQGSVEGVTRWFVKWNPDLLFTDLKAGQHLTLGTVPATVTQIADSSGTPITSANAPSLTNIAAAIEKNTSGAGGTPGQTVQIANAAGAVVSTVSTVSQPVSGAPPKTTINLSIEAAAQQAAGQAANSSIVVIQPSTGDILAVANNPASGQDTAMVGAVAPGSTFKTITTTTLLDKGLVTDLNQSVPCPGTLNAGGITLHNSENESGAGNSFLDDFAASCNNAFSSFYNQVSTSDLASSAQTYYGFNEQWDVGLGQPTTYGKVPDGANNNVAEELVGQDQIQTSPLAMASVAATIATGSFHQPILVPGTKQVAATALPSATDSDLKTLMHAVVTSGTLAGVFSNDSGVYGKTGTAEYGPQSQYDNSWTIAFKDDFAVCALAVDGGFGAATAGPEVNTVLNMIDPS